MKNNLYLSVVIPAYNEEEKIKNTIQKVSEFLNSYKFLSEIIIVDDGSADKTLPAAKAEAKRHKRRIKIFKNNPNQGKGYALKKGMTRARGEMVLFMDADLSTPLGTFDRMLPFLKNGYDIVMGSRHLPDSKFLVYQPIWRQKIGRIFNKIVFAFFIKKITDTNCGFKAYKNLVAKDLYSRLTINRWGFDVEVIYMAQKFGYRIKEVPVKWTDDPRTKVNIIKAMFSTLKELAQIKINDWRGLYK